MATEFLPKTPFPDWSKDEDYPAGAEDWAETPTKVEITGAERNAGMSPEDQLPAQWYNWLNYRYGQMLKVLVHTPMQTWEARALVVGDGFSGYSTLDNGDCGAIVTQTRFAQGDGANAPLIGGVPERAGIFAAGNGQPDTTFFSTNGFQWDTTSLPLSVNPSDACGDVPGVVAVTSLVNRKIQYSIDGFTTWASTPNLPAAGGFNSIQKTAGNRLLATVYGAGAGVVQRVWTSDDLGATWVPRTIGVDTYTFTQVANNGKSVGSGNVLVATAAAGSYGLFYSNDEGNNWVFSQLTSIGSTSASVAYSPAWDQFMVIDGNGTLLTSSDGVAWNARTTPFTADSGLQGGLLKFLACVGSVFAIAFNLQTAGGVVGGIFYSFDLGENWHWVPLTKSGDTTRNIQGVKALGCRFCAMCQGGIYLSQPLWAPSPDVIVT